MKIVNKKRFITTISIIKEDHSTIKRIETKVTEIITIMASDQIEIIGILTIETTILTEIDKATIITDHLIIIETTTMVPYVCIYTYI